MSAAGIADIAAKLGAAPTRFDSWRLPCPICREANSVTLFDRNGDTVVQVGSCVCDEAKVCDILNASLVNGDRRLVSNKAFVERDRKDGHRFLAKHLMEQGGLADVKPFGAVMIHLPVVPTPILAADLIPYDCVTILTGDGGAGKGITLQTLCTTVAALGAKPFMGRAVYPRSGKAIFLTGEDTDQQLRNRQARTCKALEIDEQAVADTLILHSVAGREFYLWSDGKPTQQFLALDRLIEAEGPDVVVLDSASTMYDDEEINRRRVSAFVRALNQLAIRHHCAIILITHTSRSSDDTVARMTSGSTAWVYQARAALQIKTTDSGTTLTLLKSNHIKPGLKVDLRWTDDAVLMAKDAPTGVLATIEQHRDDELVFAEIKARWEGDTEPLSKSPRAGASFLPAYMARMGRLEFKRASAAMYRLLDAGRIVPGRKGDLRGLRPSSHEQK